MMELTTSIPLVLRGMKSRSHIRKRNRSSYHHTSIGSSSRKTNRATTTKPQAMIPKSYRPTIDTDNLRDEDHQEQLSHRCLDTAGKWE